MAEGYKGSGKLDGMAAIVTGADSGIGRAVAVLFAREGADVAVMYLNEDDDAAETKRCVEAEGRRCITIAGDVKDPAFCNDAVQQVVKAFGRLDILVNNAAFQEHADSILDITEERFEETFRTNIFGYFHMAKAVVPHLKRGASIINTGSVTGLKGSCQAARLFVDQGRDPRVHDVAGRQPARPGHPRECGGARPGLDAAEPGRQGARRDHRVRRQHRHTGARPSRKNCRRPMCFWPRPSVPATSPASCCR